MIRSKAKILTTLRLTNSLISTSQILTQPVIHFSHSSPFSHTSNPTESQNELKISSLHNILTKFDKEPGKAFGIFMCVCLKSGLDVNDNCSSLLKVLGTKGNMTQYWFVVRELKDKGFYLHERSYLKMYNYFVKRRMGCHAAGLRYLRNGVIGRNAVDGVVKKVVDVVLGLEWGDRVEKELGEVEVEFSEEFVVRVLELLGQCPRKAFEFFRWVGGQSGFEHSSVGYNAVARGLARKDMIGEFWGVVEEMKAKGHEMDYDTYKKISRRFLKSNMMEDAAKLYAFMMDGQCRPSMQDCCNLLRSLSARNKVDLDLLFRVANRYKETGNSLTKGMYDEIHRSLTSLGKFDEAEKVATVMRNEGLEPDNITYGQLVFGLCKARRLEEACKVLDEMEQNGCVPNIKIWTILIKGHCNANEVDKALLCFTNMMERNCKPNAALLNVLVSGLLNQGKIDGAYKLLTETVNKASLRPRQATYKFAMKVLLRVKKLKEALNLLDLMMKQNYPPFAESFVQYISEHGTVDDVVKFLQSLNLKDYLSVSEAKDLLDRFPVHVREHPKVCKYVDSVETRSAAA